MRDSRNPLRVRLEASKLLAEHGWGKPTAADRVPGDGDGDGGVESDNAPDEGAYEELLAELDRLSAS